jgi:hypothetical protein
VEEEAEGHPLGLMLQVKPAVVPAADCVADTPAEAVPLLLGPTLAVEATEEGPALKDGELVGQALLEAELQGEAELLERALPEPEGQGLAVAATVLGAALTEAEELRQPRLLAVPDTVPEKAAELEASTEEAAEALGLPVGDSVLLSELLPDVEALTL